MLWHAVIPQHRLYALSSSTPPATRCSRLSDVHHGEQGSTHDLREHRRYPKLRSNPIQPRPCPPTSCVSRPNVTALDRLFYRYHCIAIAGNPTLGCYAQRCQCRRTRCGSASVPFLSERIRRRDLLLSSVGGAERDGRISSSIITPCCSQLSTTDARP